TDMACLKHMTQELGPNLSEAKLTHYFAELVAACRIAQDQWASAADLPRGQPVQKVGLGQSAEVSGGTRHGKTKKGHRPSIAPEKLPGYPGVTDYGALDGARRTPLRHSSGTTV
ncbi:hypothetical protein AB0N95_37715, partial [Streptomyces microflavus]